MGTRSENAVPPEVPEKLPWVAERGGGGMKSLQDYVKHGPCTASFFSSCFHPHRVEKNEEFPPLLHQNAELQAMHDSLLLRNSELTSQALLLKIQNQRLKEQLERQLQDGSIAFSSSVLSSVSRMPSEDYLTDSDSDEEVAMCAAEVGSRKAKLASGRDDET